MFWINPEWILQKTPNKYFSLSKTSAFHLANMFSIDHFHTDSVGWKSGLGSRAAPCSPRKEGRKQRGCACSLERADFYSCCLRAEFVFLLDNERAQESSGGEVVMDLLEGGIRGRYPGQRTIKGLWKIASQALKRRRTGWGCWELSWETEEEWRLWGETGTFNTGGFSGFPSDSFTHGGRWKSWKSQNNNRFIFILKWNWLRKSIKLD